MERESDENSGRHGRDNGRLPDLGVEDETIPLDDIGTPPAENVPIDDL